MKATIEELTLQLKIEVNNRKQSEEAKKNLDTQFAEFRKKYDSDMTAKDALMDEKTLSAEKAKRQLSKDLEYVKARLKDEVIESANRRKLAAEARDLQLRLDAEISKSDELANTLALYQVRAEQATEKLEAAEISVSKLKRMKFRSKSM